MTAASATTVFSFSCSLDDSLLLTRMEAADAAAGWLMMFEADFKVGEEDDETDEDEDDEDEDADDRLAYLVFK